MSLRPAHMEAPLQAPAGIRHAVVVYRMYYKLSQRINTTWNNLSWRSTGRSARHELVFVAVHSSIRYAAVTKCTTAGPPHASSCHCCVPLRPTGDVLMSVMLILTTTKGSSSAHRNVCSVCAHRSRLTITVVCVCLPVLNEGKAFALQQGKSMSGFRKA